MPVEERSDIARGARAPDFAEPLLGWRVWDVVESEGQLRLTSLCFRAVWRPQEETVASCRRSAQMLASAFVPPHEAPHGRCACGIYATRAAARATPYLSRHFRGSPAAVHRVVGQVLLWGTVVEAARGWRASHAYPAALYVPTAHGGLRSIVGGLRRPARAIEELAAELGAYRVPVEIVDAAATRELPELLEPGAARALR